MPSVLIIVLNWNGLDDTIECVNSLLMSSYKNIHILVVDNGSIIKPEKTRPPFNGKNVSIHLNEKNLGFTGGVNTGIKIGLQENYDFIALVNNDAKVSKDWLTNILSGMKNNTASIGCGVLLNSNGSHIDSCGESFSTWGVSFPSYRGLPAQKAPNSGYVFGATGGAVVYKSSLFREVGYFDDILFAYYEDADINFRAQLSGYKAYYSKDAIAYHQQGRSSRKIPGFTVYQMFKNTPIVFWKNIPAKLLIRTGSRFTFLYVMMFLNAVKNGSGVPAFKGFLASVWFFWTHALPKRLDTQRNNKVTSGYIWSVFYHDLPPEQTGMRKLRSFFTKD